MNIKDRLIQIVGTERFSDDKTVLYCYSRDVSLAKGVPDYVVQPMSTEEVAAIVSLVNEYEIPITARGAGSGTSGGAVPVKGGIVLDMRRMNKILSVEIENLQVCVEPGVIHADLNKELAKYDFSFPPDPASSEHCTIGGMIGNDASGMSTVKYGTTKNYVLDLEVVLPDGKIINTGSAVQKSVAGYDLTRLFVGSEGTLGVFTKAILKILPLPKRRTVLVAYFDKVEEAGKAVIEVLSGGIIPGACEIMDRAAITTVNKFDPTIGLPEVAAILLFRLEGSDSEVEEELSKVPSTIKRAGAIEVKEATTKEEAEKLWRGRKSIGAAVSRLDPKRARIYLANDIGVPIKNIPIMLKEIQRISREYDMPITTWGHIGDGNIHTGMVVDFTEEKEIKKAEEVAVEIYKSTLQLGGTTTAEHGIGVEKGKWLKEEHKSSFGLMKMIKEAIDPKNIMNPGKMGL